uniref:Uncharacterized protein n=1 Tax=Arundo donax TaxID=35708 RepID=A0A0A9G0W8_ARUDO
MDSCNKLFNSKSSSQEFPLSSLSKIVIRKCCNMSPDPSRYIARKTKSSSINLHSPISLDRICLPMWSTCLFMHLERHSWMIPTG